MFRENYFEDIFIIDESRYFSNILIIFRLDFQYVIDLKGKVELFSNVYNRAELDCFRYESKFCLIIYMYRNLLKKISEKVVQYPDNIAFRS